MDKKTPGNDKRHGQHLVAPDSVLKEEATDLEHLRNHLSSFNTHLRNEQPLYTVIYEMGKRMQNALPALNSIEGKNVVLILGPTGSGKSTIANSLISGADVIQIDQETCRATV